MTNTLAASGETEIRALIERWARAVRARDIDGILARHADDILMFDVPPPLQSKGIEAYRQTWDLFFAAAADPVVFDIVEMQVHAGGDAAFATAVMRCVDVAGGAPVELIFRLTVGVARRDGEWWIVHEHHSLPAA